VFASGLPVSDAPELLARLRRTPDRVAATLAAAPERVRVYRPGGRWSMQEHAGHLLDLEELWAGRLDDFGHGAAALRPADLDNRKTHEARHNQRPPDDLIAAFRVARMELVGQLERLSADELSRLARHPRLNQPMSVVDFCAFIAEHDDHHLAAAVAISEETARMPACALDLTNAVDAALPRLQAIDEAATLRRPAPGKWSAREIVGHLVDSASNNHQRFVRAVFQDDLVFAGYDQDAWVEAQRYQDARWDDLLSLWAGFNRHLARVMTATSEQVRRQPRARHNFDSIAFRPIPATTPATLEYFMEDYVLHLRHHLGQIFER
jgi:uncharacterized damage-inducible protein DinB